MGGKIFTGEPGAWLGPGGREPTEEPDHLFSILVESAASLGGDGVVDPRPTAAFGEGIGAIGLNQSVPLEIAKRGVDRPGAELERAVRGFLDAIYEFKAEAVGGDQDLEECGFRIDSHSRQLLVLLRPRSVAMT